MNKKVITIIIIVLIGIALAFVPRFIEKTSEMNHLILILLYVALASSWNILGGYTGQTNLGHAAFFGLGALTTRMLWFSGWPLIISLVVGGIVAVLFALLIGWPAFKLRGAYFAIGTLALGQILFATVGNVFPTISSLPLEALRNYELTSRYHLFLAITFITILTAYMLAKSGFGLGMMAVREQEDAAESLGVNAFRHKLLALLSSAFLAGLVGGAFAYYHVGYYPQFPFFPLWTFDTVTVTYIGGMGTIIGPIIGAIFFVVLKEFLSLRFVVLHLAVFGTLFILVVLFLPGGLVGLWKKVKFFRFIKQEKRGEVEVI
jgi:branched-chain amino acid transport system permease protein